MAFLQEYRNLHPKNEKSRIVERSKWRTPEEHLLKINVDGAFSVDKAAVGLTVRNHLGQSG